MKAITTNLSNNEKLVIGTVQFGISYGIANVGGQVHSNEVLSILDFAFENNINTLDTAKIYGNSEKVIGDYLKTHPNYAWDVITKLSDIDVANQLKDSSKKLTIQPDVALAHSAELYLNKVFQVELKNVKEKQFVDKIGVSLYSKKEIIQVLNSSLKPDVVQLPMNILDSQLYRQGVLGKIFEKGIEIHVRSAFLQGLFYLSKTDLDGLPLTIVNTDSVFVSLYNIPERNVEQGYYVGDNLNKWSLSRIKDREGTLIWEGKVDFSTSNKNNKEQKVNIPLNDIIKSDLDGVFIVTASLEEEDYYPEIQWVIISDIGLSTFMDKEKVHVLARSLSTAKPLKNIRISLVTQSNLIISESYTNEDGLAVFSRGLFDEFSGNKVNFINMK